MRARPPPQANGETTKRSAKAGPLPLLRPRRPREPDVIGDHRVATGSVARALHWVPSAKVAETTLHASALLGLRSNVWSIVARGENVPASTTVLPSFSAKTTRLIG